MVAWYKHDIPAWMDGTEGLDDGPYRAYHIICQLIYLNEGPIALNETGIAGRCKQHILAFRRNLRTLMELKKLVLIDGRLSNDRAATELQSVANHRATSAKGGRGSAGVAKGLNRGSEEVGGISHSDMDSNQLIINDQTTVSLLDTQHQETREEETREEKKERERECAPPAEKQSRKKIRLPMPDILVMTDTHREYAARFGFLGAKSDQLFLAFKNHHGAVGSIFSDWDAAWRKWIDNEIKFNAQRGGGRQMAAVPKL